MGTCAGERRRRQRRNGGHLRNERWGARPHSEPRGLTTKVRSTRGAPRGTSKTLNSTFKTPRSHARAQGSRRGLAEFSAKSTPTQSNPPEPTSANPVGPKTAPAQTSCFPRTQKLSRIQSLSCRRRNALLENALPSKEVLLCMSRRAQATGYLGSGEGPLQERH